MCDKQQLVTSKILTVVKTYFSTDIDTSLNASRNSLKSIIPSLFISNDLARSFIFPGGILRCENWFRTSQESLNSSKLMHPERDKVVHTILQTK